MINGLAFRDIKSAAASCLIVFCLLVLLFSAGRTAMAQEDAQEDATSGESTEEGSSEGMVDDLVQADVRYVRIHPPFILNFQARGALRYLKTEIGLQVNGDESVQAVEENLPLLKSNLVLFLSAQDEISITSPEGKFEMREKALDMLQAVIVEERPSAEILEVLFVNYFVE